MKLSYVLFKSFEDAGLTLRVYNLKATVYEFGQLIVSPTANCQLNAYRAFNTLITSGFSYKEFYEVYQDIKHKRDLLLIDIREELLGQTRKFFPEGSIISEAPYISTNNSHMVVLIVNILKPKDEQGI